MIDNIVAMEDTHLENDEIKHDHIMTTATTSTATTTSHVAATATTAFTNDTRTNNSTTTTTEPPTTTTTTAIAVTNKKRMCRFPGCERVIKSQGHCQRHGARAKRCRFGNCDKQAQGTHDGMCKRHWRIVQNQNKNINDISIPNANTVRLATPPPPQGRSVYEHIIPSSIMYRPNLQSLLTSSNSNPTAISTGNPTTRTTAATAMNDDDHNNISDTNVNDAEESSPSIANIVIEPIVPPPYNNYNSPSNATSTTNPTITTTNNNNSNIQQIMVMPLVQYLNDNVHLPSGWHRIHERRARGVYPIASITTQMEGWERQLAFIELCLLSGGTPQANYKNFCHAWGREKTFILHLSNSICERRGETERKRRGNNNNNNNKDSVGDGITTTNIKNLKKTGVIIPRTTPLEQYRNVINSMNSKSTDTAMEENHNSNNIDSSSNMNHVVDIHHMDSSGIPDETENDDNIDDTNIMDGDVDESLLMMDVSHTSNLGGMIHDTYDDEEHHHHQHQQHEQLHEEHEHEQAEV